MGVLVESSDVPYSVSMTRSSVYDTVFKRLVDLSLALVISIFCLPIIAVAALLIMLDNPGSPIFKQKRVGLNGQVFDLYKLRTMYIGTEEQNFRTQDKDDRVTRMGGFLRDAKLDELPQLWNVVKGEMSLIGPRPLSAEESKHIEQLGYSTDTPGFYPKVRPGLTGIEQINRSFFLPYRERFELNHLYEANLSWSLDWYVFLKSLAICPYVSILTIGAALTEVVILFIYYVR